MDAVDPRLPLALIPPGTKAIVYAEAQQDVYLAVPTVKTVDGKVVTRWRPSEADLRRLIEGGDVYVTLLTFNMPMQPLMVATEPPDLNALDYYGRPLPTTDV